MNNRDSPAKLTKFGQQHEDLLKACKAVLRLADDADRYTGICPDGEEIDNMRAVVARVEAVPYD